jgi:hypothetical protein
MLLTIEIMKARLTASDFCPFTLALANCPPVRDSVVSPQDVPVAGNQVSAYAR